MTWSFNKTCEHNMATGVSYTIVAGPLIDIQIIVWMFDLYSIFGHIWHIFSTYCNICHMDSLYMDSHYWTYVQWMDTVYKYIISLCVPFQYKYKMSIKHRLTFCNTLGTCLMDIDHI